MTRVAAGTPWTAVGEPGVRVTGLANGARYAFEVAATERGRARCGGKRDGDAAPGGPRGARRSRGRGGRRSRAPDVATAGRRRRRPPRRLRVPLRVGDGGACEGTPWLAAGVSRALAVGGLDDGAEYAFEVRAANAVGPGPAAAAAATPASTACRVPGDAALWSATLDVGEDVTDSGRYGHGFRDADALAALGIGRDAVGGLDGSPRFAVGAREYRVDGIRVDADGDLVFSLDDAASALSPIDAAALQVVVCGEPFAFADAVHRREYGARENADGELLPVHDGGSYVWPGAGLDWSAVATRAVWLSAPANRPATGRPGIAGNGPGGEAADRDHGRHRRRERLDRHVVRVPVASRRRQVGPPHRRRHGRRLRAPRDRRRGADRGGRDLRRRSRQRRRAGRARRPNRSARAGGSGPPTRCRTRRTAR